MLDDDTVRESQSLFVPDGSSLRLFQLRGTRKRRINDQKETFKLRPFLLSERADGTSFVLCDMNMKVTPL